jgi:hypothetical protein
MLYENLKFNLKIVGFQVFHMQAVIFCVVSREPIGLFLQLIVVLYIHPSYTFIT